MVLPWCHCATGCAVNVPLCYWVCFYCATVLLGMPILGYFADVLLGTLLLCRVHELTLSYFRDQLLSIRPDAILRHKDAKDTSYRFVPVDVKVQANTQPLFLPQLPLIFFSLSLLLNPVSHVLPTSAALPQLPRYRLVTMRS